MMITNEVNAQLDSIESLVIKPFPEVKWDRHLRMLKWCWSIWQPSNVWREGEKKIQRLLQLMPVREETTPICVKGIRISALQTDIHSEPHRNQICFKSSTCNRSNAKNFIRIEFTALHSLIARSQLTAWYLCCKAASAKPRPFQRSFRDEKTH